MNVFKKLMVALLITAGSLQAHAQEAKFMFKNRLPVARPNELIELDRAAIEKKMGRIPDDEIISIEGAAKFTNAQFDDLDGDGHWDKMVFLYAFTPLETVKLKFVLSADQIIGGNPVVHVRQKRKLDNDSFGPSLNLDSVPAGQPSTDFSKVTLPPFLTEGPAWENDKVGFRIYMDVRNTKDIWGKRTANKMMDIVGVDPKVIYHHLAPWGMDILAVGKSLGAGSLAMRVPVEGKPDTLVRLGGVNMGKIIYRKIADGPVRAIFQMEYPDWNVLGDGKLTQLKEQISIWGGQYLYESKVTLKNAPKGAHLVTGIVNLKSTTSMKDNDNRAMILSTFDQQSENSDNLGIAVLLDKANFIAFGQTPNKNSEVLNTYTVDMKVPTGLKQTSFRFYSCWQLTNPAFETEQGFKLFLSNEAKVYNSPIAIK